MTIARDVAAVIRTQRTDAFGIQKLLYYAQAWCLVENGEPCFQEAIEAWRHGPVLPSVWQHPEGGDASNVTAAQRAIVEDVLAVYGDLAGEELVETTHAEPAWLRARQGIEPAEASNRPLDLELIVRFLARSQGDTRRERMSDALERSRERARMRQLMAPHRATMLRLAQ